jgi:hypothetical protein
MHVFDSAAYGPVLAGLVETDRNRPLDAGTPVREVASQLDAMSVEAAFAHATIADRAMADTCIAAVWLLRDFLDTSHSISQAIKTREGSFWHGIMHRREGDYSNAKYWFRNVDEHPVYNDLTVVAQQLAADHENHVARDLTGWPAWNAYRFVDLCQTAVEDGDGEPLLRAIQQAEWELLFDFCYQHAIG